MVALSAAVVAAIIAFSKLVADKETRVSDFRKEWISSFRSSLSDLLGQAYVIAGRVRIRKVHGATKDARSTSAAPTTSSGEASVASQVNAESAGALRNQTDASTPSQSETDTSESTRCSNPAVGVAAVDPALDQPVTSDTPKCTCCNNAAAPSTEPVVDFSDLEPQLTQHWEELRKAHRTVLLHLNFAETAKPLSSNRMGLEQNPELHAIWDALIANSSAEGMTASGKFNADDASKRSSAASLLLVAELEKLLTLLLGHYNDISGEEHYEKVKHSIDRATLLGNLVIKPEWNRIKRGERRYWISLWLGGLVSLGGILAIIWLVHTRPATSPTPLPSQQWVEFKR